MPADGQSLPQGEPGAAQQSAPPEPTPPTVPPPRIPFTFINQHSDEKSLGDKRISNPRERHAIRSHVMKTVRHSENLAGKKRPTGREKGRKASEASSATLSNPALGDVSSSSPSTNSNVSPASALTIATENMRQSLTYILPNDEDTRDIDFGDATHDDIVDALEYYCFNTFIPMTFPVEQHSKEEIALRQARIIESKNQTPAVFFGMMATVAAHRAILTGKAAALSKYDSADVFLDPSYVAMKDEAISAARARMDRLNQIDVECVEALFSLIGAACIMGDFEEARMHLKGIQQVLTHNAALIDLTSPESHWIPLTDVKAAVGMLSKPLFLLPWVTQPMSFELRQKIAPANDSPLDPLGVGFRSLRGLGTEIQRLLQSAVHICWFTQFSHEKGNYLDATEHEEFRRRSLELEYDLLSYVYDRSPADINEEPNTRTLSPLENMIRLAVLALISNAVTKVLPPAGVGRALTGHEFLAARTYQESPTDLDRDEIAAVLWVMMQYAQGAAGQPEEEHFFFVIGNCLRRLEITDWASLRHLMCWYLWMPSEQEEPWKKILMAVIASTPSSDASAMSTLSPGSVM